MSFDAVERSVQDAQRVDLFTFALPGVTYRLCSGSESVSFDGNSYTVAPISCSSVPLVPIGGNVREVTVSIALDHELAVALRQGGIPPQNTLVTIQRIHIGDLGSRLRWRGYIGGTSTDDEFTRIRVPNKIDLALDCQLPAKAAERRCSHVLYDVGCGVDPASFRIDAVVALPGSLTIEVDSISGKPDHWAKDGRVVRLADGEERSVVEQIGTTVTIDFPFRALANGDALRVFAGCDHSLLQDHGCKVKFNNAINYGGEPELPTSNPSSPVWLGVRVH